MRWSAALFYGVATFARARDPGAPVIANVIGGFTDCSAFRAHKSTCYGSHRSGVVLEDSARPAPRGSAVLLGSWLS